ncbi:nuclear transport factor 2 family protein [Patulibacter minatonensis]|uniref:nuclear transport factor 2 family protein n=1 Tax=Patulibacter minatonensis TaxID=298163 RepID=UPI00047CDD39|nr:nuclear transport factor 2 family protein [Patulibacter minatonensis]
MSTAETTQVETNKQIIRDFMVAFGSGDIPATMDFMTEDATWWVAGTMCLSGTYSKAEFEKLLGGVVVNCKQPISLTPEAFTAEGDRVAVETESYTETNEGKVYNNHYHFLFVLRDGKIAQIKEFLDTQHAAEVFCG